MSRWIVVLVMLLMFIAGIAAAHPQRLSGSASSLDPTCHSDGSPCPDAGACDHPCGPACPCTCCPGHGAAVVPAPYPLCSFNLPPTRGVTVNPPRDLYPREVHFRIFHPPRA
jgi:hypothetical protein